MHYARKTIIHWFPVKIWKSGSRVHTCTEPRYRHKQLPSSQISRSLLEASVRLLYYFMLIGKFYNGVNFCVMNR